MHRGRRLRRKVLLFSIALLGACAHRPLEAPISTASSGEFFPLHPGTLWVYRVRDFAGRIALQRVVVRGSYYLKSRETSGMVVEESGGVAGDFEIDLDVSWQPVFYYRRGDFLYKFSGVGYADTQLREYHLGLGEEKVLPADPSRQSQWESDFQVFHVGQGIGYGIRTISVARPPRESVTVPAGRFEGCLRVETETVSTSLPRRADGVKVSFHYTDWYAPGIGLVKSAANLMDDPRAVSVTELISFRDGERRD